MTVHIKAMFGTQQTVSIGLKLLQVLTGLEDAFMLVVTFLAQRHNWLQIFWQKKRAGKDRSVPAAPLSA